MSQSNHHYARQAIPNGTRSNVKILYCGALMIQGHNGWMKRWFVLFDNRQLSYYHNRYKFQDNKHPINSIDLKQVTAIQPVPNAITPKSQSMTPQMQKSLHSPTSTSQNNGARHTYHGYHNEDSDIDNSTTMSSITNESPFSTFKSLMGRRSKEKSNDGSDSNYTFIAEFPFEVVTPSRTYLLCSLDAYSFNDWLENLRNVTIGKKIYGGWLTKQGSKNKSWEKLWFVIFDTREIRYYETEKASQEKGSIILDDLQIMNLLDDKNAKSKYKKKNVFELICGGRKWVLVANSKEEKV